MCCSLTSPRLCVSDHFPFILASAVSHSSSRWAQGYLGNPPPGQLVISTLPALTPRLLQLWFLLSKWPSVLSSWVCGPYLCSVAICLTPFCDFLSDCFLLVNFASCSSSLAFFWQLPKHSVPEEAQVGDRLICLPRELTSLHAVQSTEIPAPQTPAHFLLVAIVHDDIPH